MRQRSFDLDKRKQQTYMVLSRKNSDSFLDPNHSAILFKDSKGVSLY